MLLLKQNLSIKIVIESIRFLQVTLTGTLVLMLFLILVLTFKMEIESIRLLQVILTGIFVLMLLFKKKLNF